MLGSPENLVKMKLTELPNDEWVEANGFVINEIRDKYDPVDDVTKGPFKIEVYTIGRFRTKIKEEKGTGTIDIYIETIDGS